MKYRMVNGKDGRIQVHAGDCQDHERALGSWLVTADGIGVAIAAEIKTARGLTPADFRIRACNDGKDCATEESFSERRARRLAEVAS